jgi:NifU-like protein
MRHAIASSSALTEMVKDAPWTMPPKLPIRTSPNSWAACPRKKMHCSVMGMEALEAAIANYRGEEPKQQEGELICECFGVTDKDIERVVEQNNLSTLEEVTDYTKAGGGCGNCQEKIEALLFRLLTKRREAEAAKAEKEPKQLTTLQKNQAYRGNHRKPDPPGASHRRRRYRAGGRGRQHG